MSSRHQLLQAKAKRYRNIEREKVTFILLELYYVKNTFGLGLHSIFVRL